MCQGLGLELVTEVVMHGLPAHWPAPRCNCVIACAVLLVLLANILPALVEARGLPGILSRCVQAVPCHCSLLARSPAIIRVSGQGHP